MLRATDPKTGLSSTATRVVTPNKVNLTFESEPSNLELVVDGEVIRTPSTIVSWANHFISTNVYDQNHLQFLHWSDTSDAQRVIRVQNHSSAFKVEFRNVCVNAAYDRQTFVDVGSDRFYEQSRYFCLSYNLKFGIDGSGAFGLFRDSELIWTPFKRTEKVKAHRWKFESEIGSVIVLSSKNETIWTSSTGNHIPSQPGSSLIMDQEGVRVQTDFRTLWQVDAASLKADSSVAKFACATPISFQWMVSGNTQYEVGEFLCLRDRYKLGIDETGLFGFFLGSDVLWSPNNKTAGRWIFQQDGNLVVHAAQGGDVVYTSMDGMNYNDADGSELLVNKDGLSIRKLGSTLWELRIEDRCAVTADIDGEITVSVGDWHTSRDFLCLEGHSVDHRFGIDESGTFGYFIGDHLAWKPKLFEGSAKADSWRFQTDGNLVVRYGSQVVWTSRGDTEYDSMAGSYMIIKKGGLMIQHGDNTLWNVNVNKQKSAFGMGHCVNEEGALDTTVLFIPVGSRLGRGQFYCLQGTTHRFGIDEDGLFGYFVDAELKWKPPSAKDNTSGASVWSFESDGTLVLWSTEEVIWESKWESVGGNDGGKSASLLLSTIGLSIENNGSVIWHGDLDGGDSIPSGMLRVSKPSLRGMVPSYQLLP
jgi:hypothetical protein